MKFVVNSLRRGQRVWAGVSECLAHGDLIVSFDGDLIRVANRSNKTFKKGEKIQLEVSAIKPLQFHLVHSCRDPYRLNRSI